jgi:cytochrome c oxidase subunit II
VHCSYSAEKAAATLSVSRRRRPAALLFLFVLLPGSANAAAPLNYLEGHGSKADPVVALTWGTLAISVGVTAIIGILLIAAIWRRGTPAAINGRIEIIDPRHGMEWIWIGVGISTLVLLAVCVWTMIVLARIASPARKAPFTVEIIGRQWWWEVHYVSGNAARDFTTANEIHIPTGMPVVFKLIGADVIHSFWIPQLSGKTDIIPGQTNRMWLEARKPGIYYGQCTEYCGVQHANMKMLLIAQPPTDFQGWWDRQLQLASTPAAPTAELGQRQFVVHCGSCHAVRGTDAGGAFGPDLSHLMTRKTIAAGTLPNTTGNLMGWVSDPQSIKPGCLMPPPALGGPELSNIRAYLQTLN